MYNDTLTISPQLLRYYELALIDQHIPRRSLRPIVHKFLSILIQ